MISPDCTSRAPCARAFAASFLLLASAVCPAAETATELVSRPASPTTLPANGYSSDLSASDDGRWVVFTSDANNLVPGDSNGHTDLIRVDRQTGEAIIASQAGAVPADGPIFPIAIDVSNDGRYVVFLSEASNLVPGDGNGRMDLFRKDLTSGEILRVASSSALSAPPFRLVLSGDGTTLVFAGEVSDWIENGSSGYGLLQVDWSGPSISKLTTEFPSAGPFPDLSSDGSCLAYQADLGGGSRVRIRRLATGAEFWAIEGLGGEAPNGPASHFVLDAGCHYLGFSSLATNIVAGVTQPDHVYRRDLDSSAVAWVSQREFPEEFSETSRVGMSANGQHLVYGRFLRDANYNILGDAFLEYRDLAMPFAERVQHSSKIDGFSLFLGPVGGLIALSGDAVSGDLNGFPDVYAANAPGLPLAPLLLPFDLNPVLAANGGSTESTGPTHMAASNDRLVAFESLASNLVDGGIENDTFKDVYLRDRSTNTTTRLLQTLGIEPDADVEFRDISEDGRFVGMRSCATNLVPADNNGQCDLFLVDRSAPSIELVNVTTGGIQAALEFETYSLMQISNDGRFVASDTTAANLAPETAVMPQVFVRDRSTGVTQLAMSNYPQALDGPTRMTSMAGDGAFIALALRGTSPIPGCYLLGLDLLTGIAECLALDPGGSFLPQAQFASLSADGRFAVYSGADFETIDIMLLDRSAGTVRQLPLGGFPPAQVQIGIISGNGRFIATSGYLDGVSSFGYFDLVLNDWVVPPSTLVGGISSINHDGTAVVFSSIGVLDGADLNGGVPDVYRMEIQGDGLFGGGWQGGFD
jgi:hypothetical protein